MSRNSSEDRRATTRPNPYPPGIGTLIGRMPPTPKEAEYRDEYAHKHSTLVTLSKAVPP